MNGCGGTPTEAGGALQYASLLRIERADSFIVCDVENAWRRGDLLHRYVLVPKAQPLPTRLPEGTLLRTPLERAVVFTSVHSALLFDLGAASKIAGLCDCDYLVRPDLRAAVDSGKMLNMGAALQPNTEQIVLSRADALLVSPFQNAGYGAIERLGVPLVECADYMETSPLGRAEWMRFYGLLFGCEERADSLFKAIETDYNALSLKAKAAAQQPRVLADVAQGGTWLVPAGESTMGRLFSDAGADYCFGDIRKSGSASLSFERVFETASDADFWFIRHGAPIDLTYEQLARERAVYRQFRPWKEGRIYYCNVSRTPFFENAPFRPDLLLRDVVSVLHPELVPAGERLFFSPLKHD